MMKSPEQSEIQVSAIEASEIESSEIESSEIQSRAEFDLIRYAQCWEDADILVEALKPERGGIYVSIASAGDNALAILSKAPDKVVALDLNATQLACLALRVAAYKELNHKELLELVGSIPSIQRAKLYQRCRSLLNKQEQAFWDANPQAIEQGIGAAGKFERYFALFKNRIMPLIHSRKTITKLLDGGDLEQRREFYDKVWNNWRWRGLFKIFFSRFVMGRMGRDPEFFKYVEGSVSDRILMRTKHALTELDPHDNPYLQWILTGDHPFALPYALREENFDAIRNNLDRLEWRQSAIEAYLNEAGKNAIAGYNLSDIFEYMSEESFHELLDKLIRAGTHGARLAYWNMLAPRQAPESFYNRVKYLPELSEKLHFADKAFFYNKFIVEEVL